MYSLNGLFQIKWIVFGTPKDSRDTAKSCAAIYGIYPLIFAYCDILPTLQILTNILLRWQHQFWMSPFHNFGAAI